jgi:hypothetical protein
LFTISPDWPANDPGLSDIAAAEHLDALFCGGSSVCARQKTATTAAALRADLHSSESLPWRAFVPLEDHAEFLGRQSRVHARVSVNFPAEFGCCLAAPLRRAGSSSASHEGN